jgi:protein-S-isoprenylcysteine O-methyltransferase Ste14
MGIDIRIPIGLLFVVLGAVLAVFGAVSDPAMYARSLGYNVNLWWGLTLFGFGLVLLYLVRRSRSRESVHLGAGE